MDDTSEGYIAEVTRIIAGHYILPHVFKLGRLRSAGEEATDTRCTTDGVELCILDKLMYSGILYLEHQSIYLCSTAERQRVWFYNRW